MVTTYLLITIIGGCLFYFLRPQWFFLYSFSIEPLIFPLFANLEGVLDADLFQELQLCTDRIMLYLLTILISFEFFIKRKRVRGIRTITTTGGILIVYLVVQNILIHFDMSVLYGPVRYVIVLPLVVILMLLNKKTIPPYKDSFIFLLIIVGLQAIWAVLELNGIYPFLIFYTGFGVTFSESLISGTFIRFNNMTNFLTTIYLCFSFDYFIKKNISSIVFYLFSFIILFLILVSGAKMSIALFVFIWTVNIIFNWNQNKLMGIGSVLIIVLLFSVMDILSSMYPGIDRAMTGFSNIFEGSEEQNTSSISAYLYDNYFFRSPLIGNGLSWKGEYAYDSIKSIVLIKADARLMYTLVEYGILGMTFYFIYFYNLFWMPVRNKSRYVRFFIFYSFAYFCIMTFTEGGFFDYCNVVMVLVYISMFQESMNIQKMGIKT